MLLPVQIASGSSRKPNSTVLQITHSSAQPERCSAIITNENTASKAKSRSDEASTLFSTKPSNPSSRATISRSISRLVPASAAEPKGKRLRRLRQSTRRSRSRANFSTYARK